MKKGLQKMVSITIALSMLVVGLTACGSEKTVLIHQPYLKMKR